MAVKVIYWDASAILSVLFRDDNSEPALRCARSRATHLLSSLAWAESHAVIARLEREGAVAPVLAGAAREVLATGPWRRANVTPDWELVVSLTRRWPLRGADLWHLAAAKELQTDLPELTLLSFDARLATAAAGEGLH